jgi:hypothetical protein
LRLSSAALRSSGTWLSAARRTTARLGRSMSTRAGSGVSCLKKARERRRATGGQNPSSGRRSRAPPPPPREPWGWREQERGARTWGWRSLFLFFLRRWVFDKGGGVRRCVREGETQAGEIKTYLTLGFGQGAARGGFMTMGCYAGRWGPEVRYPLLWLLLMTDWPASLAAWAAIGTHWSGRAPDSWLQRRLYHFSRFGADSTPWLVQWLMLMMIGNKLFSILLSYLL